MKIARVLAGLVALVGSLLVPASVADAAKPQPMITAGISFLSIGGVTCSHANITFSWENWAAVEAVVTVEAPDDSVDYALQVIQFNRAVRNGSGGLLVAAPPSLNGTWLNTSVKGFAALSNRKGLSINDRTDTVTPTSSTDCPA